MASSTTTNSNPPLPIPPFIDLPGLPNLRDAGGYVLAADHPDATKTTTAPPRRMVRRGVLFRASEPSRLTDAEAAHLTDRLGIRTVYDLRSQTEIDRDAAGAAGDSRRQVREWPGAERVFAPVFLREDYSPEAVALRFSSFAMEGTEGFVRVYKHILETGASPSGAQPFATILRHLAATPATPLLVHCTAGKDRTGVLIALVLSLCGVPDDVVAHEYSLTDLGLGSRREEFVAHLVQTPPLLGDRPAALRMVSSRRESMRDTLAMLRERWGGAEAFVRRECGLSEAEIEAVRANLIVDVGGEHVPIDWEEHAKLML